MYSKVSLLAHADHLLEERHHRGTSANCYRMKGNCPRGNGAPLLGFMVPAGEEGHPHPWEEGTLSEAYTDLLVRRVPLKRKKTCKETHSYQSEQHQLRTLIYGTLGDNFQSLCTEENRKMVRQNYKWATGLAGHFLLQSITNHHRAGVMMETATAGSGHRRASIALRTCWRLLNLAV